MAHIVNLRHAPALRAALDRKPDHGGTVKRERGECREEGERGPRASATRKESRNAIRYLEEHRPYESRVHHDGNLACEVAERLTGRTIRLVPMGDLPASNQIEKCVVL